MLEICKIGSQVLRQPCRELTEEEITDKRMKKLIKSMQETMYAAPGVGLAAPQIGQPVQLIVVEDKLEYIEASPAELVIERERAPLPFTVLINPQMTIVGTETREFLEGCLSMPGYRALVPRSHKVEVTYQDQQGSFCKQEFTGWQARIVQHEVDHLRGILYVDRMDTRSLLSEEALYDDKK